MVKKIQIISLEIVFCLILFVYSVPIVSAYSQKNECENIIKEIAPYILDSNNKTISRRQCISSIMKLIGVDEETAIQYVDADYDEPIFRDISGDKEDGYIIIAGLNNVANGVGSSRIKDFEPDRAVTTKETLAFMLRCLTEVELVLWDNIMEDSVKIGLLREDELTSYIAGNPIKNEQFYTLLCRMLDENRYLYWPTEEPPTGYAKSMQVDLTGSIKYIDKWRNSLGTRH